MADNANTPVGYGHDRKGGAGGENVGAGKPGVAHTALADAVAGKGSETVRKGASRFRWRSWRHAAE